MRTLPQDLHTVTVDAAAAFERRHALADVERPTLADAFDDRPPTPLPDPYRCVDPWCPSAAAGPHLHGTRPDGRRV